LNKTQSILLPFLLCVGVLLIGANVSVEQLNTLLIFITLTGLGMWLCHRTCVELGDPKLKILSTFWLLKVIITLFLLYVAWIPRLDPSSIDWGYDPQRFYFDARDLIENDWKPIAASTYQGIIYYYGVIFFLFGHNPVIPALINSFVTLIGILFLVRCVYSFVKERRNKDWTIAWLLMLPELLWYDVMTSRETLMAVLVIFTNLSVGRYLVGVKNVSLVNTILLASTTLFMILAVRTSMAMTVVASIVCMMLLLPSENKKSTSAKVLLFFLAIIVMSVGPLIQKLAGGGEIDYFSTLETLQALDSSFSDQQVWSNNSLGLLLTPTNIWQTFLFLPARMVLYLVAPLPNVSISAIELINGSWNEWQRLMTISGSFLMLLGLPFALASTLQVWRIRRYQPSPLVLHIAFWITFMAVAGGNIIVHERYRIMFTMLLFACIWFGYTRSPRREVKRCALYWFGMITTGGILYIGYKYLG
jgi:hypothetical protein